MLCRGECLIRFNAEKSNMQENRITIDLENPGTREEIEAANLQDEQFQRNSAWLQAHIAEVYGEHRGKSICVAGQQLFVGDSAREAVDKAVAAHPEDKGLLLRYIYKEKVARIYDLRR